MGLRLTSDDFNTFVFSIPIWVVINMTPIGWFLHIWLNSFEVVIFGAIGTAFLAHKIDPDGKPLLRYLRGAIMFMFRSHVTRGGFDRLPRSLRRKNGLKHHFGIRVKRAWTKGEIPLPAVIWGSKIDFKNSIHVDVQMNRERTVFRKSRRLGLATRHTVRGLRPGEYQVSERKIVTPSKSGVINDGDSEVREN